jgi:membrane-associated phospholipid phosphatase
MQNDEYALDQNARLIWWIIVGMTVAIVVSFGLTGLRVDPTSNIQLLAAVPAFAGVAWFYRKVRPEPRLYRAIETTGQMLVVFLLGLLLSYAAMATNLPYRDAELHAFDQWLGLDRRAYVDFAKAQPLIAAISPKISLSIQPQTALIPLVLIIAGQISRLQQFVVALGVALAITVTVATFFPAVAAFVYLDLTPSGYANLSTSVYTHVPTLEALRSGTMQTIRLDNFEGLLTFPSFHTTAAVLFAWALWTVPYVRWPAMLLNVAMIATTPLDGAHYFVDLAGGLVVAAIAIATSARVGAAIGRTAGKHDKVLAGLSRKRPPLMPELPTAREQGPISM